MSNHGNAKGVTLIWGAWKATWQNEMKMWGGELRLFYRVLFSDNEVVGGSVSGSIGTNRVKDNKHRTTWTNHC
jgi:hypothetical protein